MWLRAEWSNVMSKITLPLFAIPIIGIMTANAGISSDMYLPAFPAVAKDFDVSPSSVQTSLSVFFIGFGIGQIFYGPISDSIGRKWVILIGLLSYGILSALCAVSTSIDFFIGFRFFQGFAGAAGAVLGRAIIRDVFDGAELAKAMSLLMLVLTAGPMMAPLIGSFFLELSGWRSIFWVLALYGVLWCILILLIIPETLKKENQRPFKLYDLVQSFSMVLKHKSAMGYTLCVAFGFATLFAYITATPFIYMNIYGVTPKEYAIFFAVNVGAMALFTVINRKIVDRFTLNNLLKIWTWVLVLASSALLLGIYTNYAGVWGLAVPLFFIIGSLSPIAANGISGCLRPFAHNAGMASSVFGVFQFGGGGLIGAIIAQLNDGTAHPLGLVIISCAVTSFLVLRLMNRNDV